MNGRFRWNGGGYLLGIFAIALGSGILIAAIFPVGALLFLVAFLLIACGCGCCRRRGKGRGSMRIVVWRSPKALRGLLRRLFRVEEG